MSLTNIIRNKSIDQYLEKHLRDESPILKGLRAETAQLEWARMQISHEQGQFMSLLIKSLAAVNTLEIGVFTGYSTLVTALALPLQGKIIACDVSKEWTDIGRKYWRQAGVADKIDLCLRPASETLDDLIISGKTGSFDFAFIDADKTSYDLYYERCLKLLRPGGLIMIDNALWGGAVSDPSVSDADTAAIRALNQKIRNDSRVDSYLLPVGDGIHMVYLSSR